MNYFLLSCPLNKCTQTENKRGWVVGEVYCQIILQLGAKLF